MFVLNRKTGSIQECHNMDAIKSCRKDMETYSVAERREDLTAGGSQRPSKEPEKEKAEKYAAGAAGAAPGPATEDRNGNGGQPVPAEGNKTDEVDRLDKGKLAGMDWQELRETAKELGIPGYMNMNRETLTAMILNH